MRDNACRFAQTTAVDTSNLENLFYLTSIVKALGDTCKVECVCVCVHAYMCMHIDGTGC